MVDYGLKGRVAIITGANNPWGIGADDRTRTCTLAHWNLNPMSLPIPPHPHILRFILSHLPVSVDKKANRSRFWLRLAGY